MKSIFLFVLLFHSFCVTLAQEPELVYLYGTRLAGDTQETTVVSGPSGKPTVSIVELVQSGRPQKAVLLYTAKKKPVELFFFPGLSGKKALVIGGMHGSELSSIELATTLISQLSEDRRPYYSVIIIPSLFPDNAEAALLDKTDRVKKNTGRQTSGRTADPNRQMPLPGMPFLQEKSVDAFHRKIENENRALLQLLQTWQPHRVLSLHSIRDESKAGVFADPRTDCRGNAQGFGTDRELALLMAEHIRVFGGDCPGNRLDANPTALYHLDPPAAAKGKKQVRSFQQADGEPATRGVTLGTWCSTAVCAENVSLSRPAIRTFTLEFPGYQRTQEYKTAAERERAITSMEAYASAVRHYFLRSYFVEASAGDEVVAEN
ncbi:M14 family zinc carboxypeptidase [Flavisolibacter nicotianae]|uniref:M14 family zinc carboxypeptidase n=1 Tax=Flavisolibacter nicotianae TaxID=2364882 RepID=UPI000EACD1D2|nr:M14 family zinc carboxypeptidase [Flavisolibacter nicotianae]